MSKEIIHPDSADSPLIPPPKRKHGCCGSLKRCLCFCCIKNNFELSKKLWEKIWAKISGKRDFDPVYMTLLHLYSQQEALEELQACNIRPNFKASSRDDLEFYVPQICNLLLFIYHIDIKELLSVIMSMCSSSFYFAHRVLWFINSTNFDELDPSNLDPKVLSQAVTKITKDTCGIFIEKGEKLQELVEELGMEIGIRGILSQEKINSDLVRGSVTSALEKYNEFEVNELEEPLEPKYISMQYFPGNSEVDPFSSTMAFIEKLTDIASLIMRFPDKKAILQQELSKINTLLPACVYIPFSNSKIRESFILHIPVQEAKVFITKERAPYLICVEVFRPYIEFQLSKNQTNSLPRRSQSESQNISITKSFCHADDTSFLKRTVEEAINPNSFRFPTKSLIIPTMSRPPSYSVADAGHYEKFRFTNNPVQSLGAIYEANEGTKSEDVIKSFKQQAERIRKASPYGSLKTWALVHLIVKSGDDLRQEQLAMQIISFFLQTFREKKLKLWLYAYDIIATGPNCGILECVPDAISLDALKKATERVTLLDHFNTQYGGEDSRELKKAKKEFMKSLAGYSLLCYILQIKDRHNGNILLDRNGHLIHIDFGFMLSNSPGGNMNFEKAPFKLTAEFESVLGGRRSNLFIKFRTACVKGYIALKEKADQIKLMVEMMRTGSGASLGCFSGGEQATNGILERLIPRTNMSERDCKQYINDLIDESLDNWSTRCYDKFQYCCQNIFY